MVEIVGKSYKQIQVTEDVDQLEFLEATEEAWEYIAGSYRLWNPVHRNKDGTLGDYEVGPSWPNHKGFGGVLSLKDGYEIIGIDHVRKGVWGLHINNLFYTNIHFLLTEHKGVEVEKYGLFLGNALGHFPMGLARHWEYDKIVEITQFEGMGFSFCIIDNDGNVTAWSSAYLANVLGINLPEWSLKWPTINIPA